MGPDADVIHVDCFLDFDCLNGVVAIVGERSLAFGLTRGVNTSVFTGEKLKPKLAHLPFARWSTRKAIPTSKSSSALSFLKFRLIKIAMVVWIFGKSIWKHDGHDDRPRARTVCANAVVDRTNGRGTMTVSYLLSPDGKRYNHQKTVIQPLESCITAKPLVTERVDLYLRLMRW